MMIGLTMSAESRKSGRGVAGVYVFEDPANALVKIGKASDIYIRFSSLKTGAPNIIWLGDFAHNISRKPINLKQAESALHEHFKSDRFVGEWFRMTEEIVHWISFDVQDLGWINAWTPNLRAACDCYGIPGAERELHWWEQLDEPTWKPC